MRRNIGCHTCLYLINNFAILRTIMIITYLLMGRILFFRQHLTDILIAEYNINLIKYDMLVSMCLILNIAFSWRVVQNSSLPKALSSMFIYL